MVSAFSEEPCRALTQVFSFLLPLISPLSISYSLTGCPVCTFSIVDVFTESLELVTRGSKMHKRHQVKCKSSVRLPR